VGCACGHPAALAVSPQGALPLDALPRGGEPAALKAVRTVSPALRDLGQAGGHHQRDAAGRGDVYLGAAGFARQPH